VFCGAQVEAGCDPLAPNASGLYLPHLAARHASQNVLRKLIQWEERRSGNGSRVLLWKDAEGAPLITCCSACARCLLVQILHTCVDLTNILCN
jgi:hypothetical protein